LDSFSSLFQADLFAGLPLISGAAIKDKIKEKTWQRSRSNLPRGNPSKGKPLPFVQCTASISMIGPLHAASRAAGLRAGVRQTCGCYRNKLRDPAADPRRRRAQQ